MTEWFKELWERTAKRERGEEEEVEKFPDIFIWREQVKRDEALKKFFDIVQKKLERYANTIKRSREARERFDEEGKSEDTESEVEAADMSQELAHDALVSAINFFVRNCEQKWIKIDIDLEKLKDRDWGRNWAMKNAETAKKIVEVEKKKVEEKKKKEETKNKK